MTSIEVYNKVLTGEFNTFPKYFWSGLTGLQNSIEIIKYVFDELEYSRDDILNNVNFKFWDRLKLRGMIKTIYNSNAIYPIIIANIMGIKIWEFNVKGPKSYWNSDTAREATKWLVEKLNYNKYDILNKLCKQDFINNNLGNMLCVVYGNCVCSAVLDAFPDIHAWEYKRVPRKFWTRLNRRCAIIWLVEEVLSYTKNEHFNVTFQEFKDNGLYGMLQHYYKNNTRKALLEVYEEDINESMFICRRAY